MTVHVKGFSATLQLQQITSSFKVGKTLMIIMEFLAVVAALVGSLVHFAAESVEAFAVTGS